MNTLIPLLKREYWEHKGGFFWAPFWTATAIALLTLAGLISVSVTNKGNVNIGVPLEKIRQGIEANDLIAVGNALDLVQVTLVGIAFVVIFFVLFFYLLGALYDDRRDRSVLFWKSLPISDTATVVSKALSAGLVAPLVALVIATLGYLAILLMLTGWGALHGGNLLPAVGAAQPLGIFVRLALMVATNLLWALPAIGWLLFWSAFVRSKPFVWAVLLPILVIVVDGWFRTLQLPSLGSVIPLKHVVGRLLLSIMPGSWFGSNGMGNLGYAIGRGSNFNEKDVVQNIAWDRLLNLLQSADLWIGVAAGVALLAAAVWLRRTRIEVNV